MSDILEQVIAEESNLTSDEIHIQLSLSHHDNHSSTPSVHYSLIWDQLEYQLPIQERDNVMILLGTAQIQKNQELYEELKNLISIVSTVKKQVHDAYQQYESTLHRRRLWNERIHQQQHHLSRQHHIIQNEIITLVHELQEKVKKKEAQTNHHHQQHQRHVSNADVNKLLATPLPRPLSATEETLLQNTLHSSIQQQQNSNNHDNDTNNNPSRAASASTMTTRPSTSATALRRPPSISSRPYTSSRPRSTAHTSRSINNSSRGSSSCCHSAAGSSSSSNIDTVTQLATSVMIHSMYDITPHITVLKQALEDEQRLLQDDIQWLTDICEDEVNQLTTEGTVNQEYIGVEGEENENENGNTAVPSTDELRVLSEKLRDNLHDMIHEEEMSKKLDIRRSQHQLLPSLSLATPLSPSSSASALASRVNSGAHRSADNGRPTQPLHPHWKPSAPTTAPSISHPYPQPQPPAATTRSWSTSSSSATNIRAKIHAQRKSSMNMSGDMSGLST